METRHLPVAGTRFADRYELRDLLGRGGMASVYRAWDERLRREVAIKVLVPALASDPVIRRRFEAEANAAARISHPNVVMIFDANERDGEPFIVMECLSGATLANEVAKGRLSLERVRRVAFDVLLGLGAAHRLGLVHRDIKPSNLLIAGDGLIKVADFGIAKSLAGADHTATGDVVGSISYIAPERLRGRPASVQSDLYSLGVVLYEIVTGVRPYAAESPAAVGQAILSGSPRPVRELRPDADDALVHVIERALQTRPADRFASADAMRTELGGADLESTVSTPVAAMFGTTAGFETSAFAAPPSRPAPARPGAVPQVGRPGVHPARASAQRQSRRSLAFGAALIAVLLAGAGVILATRPDLTPSSGTTPTTVAVGNAAPAAAGAALTSTVPTTAASRPISPSTAPVAVGATAPAKAKHHRGKGHGGG